jgi:hypothetical protein
MLGSEAVGQFPKSLPDSFIELLHHCGSEYFQRGFQWAFASRLATGPTNIPDVRETFPSVTRAMEESASMLSAQGFLVQPSIMLVRSQLALLLHGSCLRVMSRPPARP